ncbi:hypothetical protein BH09ACT7_BH09ACT7_21400 [soil metagenome]
MSPFRGSSLASEPAGGWRKSDITVTNVELHPRVHEYFRTSQVPLLAAWGRNDEIFGPAGALALSRDLPHAEINLLDGGHFLLESRLDAAVALIRPFLAEHDG